MAALTHDVQVHIARFPEKNRRRLPTFDQSVSCARALTSRGALAVVAPAFIESDLLTTPNELATTFHRIGIITQNISIARSIFLSFCRIYPLLDYAYGIYLIKILSGETFSRPRDVYKYYSCFRRSGIPAQIKYALLAFAVSYSCSWWLGIFFFLVDV